MVVETELEASNIGELNDENEKVAMSNVGELNDEKEKVANAVIFDEPIGIQNKKGENLERRLDYPNVDKCGERLEQEKKTGSSSLNSLEKARQLLSI